MKKMLIGLTTIIIFIGCGINDKNKKTSITESTIGNNSKVLKTGQNMVYESYDDGYYQSGINRNYTRDDEKEIVTDNATGLIWQDNSDVKDKPSYLVDYKYGLSNQAEIFCKNFTLGGLNNWRLPTIYELVELTDKGRIKPAINPIFKNIAYEDNDTTDSNTSDYWSSTSTHFTDDRHRDLTVNFKYGKSKVTWEHSYGYIRCVHDKLKN